jgi:hypothetical protein
MITFRNGIASKEKKRGVFRTDDARCQSFPSTLEARPVAPGGGSQASRSGWAKFVNQ